MRDLKDELGSSKLTANAEMDSLCRLGVPKESAEMQVYSMFEHGLLREPAEDIRDLLFELGCTKKITDEFLEFCSEMTQKKLSIYCNLVSENTRLLLREDISLETCLWWMIIYPDFFTQSPFFFFQIIKTIKEVAGSDDLFFLEKQFCVELKVPVIERMLEGKNILLFEEGWKMYLEEEETEKTKKFWEDYRETTGGIFKDIFKEISETNWDAVAESIMLEEEELNQMIPDEDTPSTTEWLPNQDETEPPIPYDGEEPYIFISYNHDDKTMVFPIIRRLQAEGYRVWYDKGINGGAEWAREIARRIPQCGNFISFVTPNFVESDHCKDEFQWAKQKVLYNAIVFLSKTELDEWMDMQSCRWQRISRHDRTEEAFYRDLFEIEGLERCREKKND